MENNKLLIANLKMNMTIKDVKNYINVIENSINSKNVIICPSSIYVPYFINKNFNVGIQNFSVDNCTGEISSIQAESMGINFSIIGHSERRILFKENSSLINKKIKEAIKNNITPIICIGETLEQKEMLKTNVVLKRQVIDEFLDIDLSKVIFAYEPIWAIGTKIVPSIEEITSTIDYIKCIVKEIYNKDVKVLYGGSIDEKNINQLVLINNIDGFLVGASSIDPNKFLRIVEVVVGQ